MTIYRGTKTETGKIIVTIDGAPLAGWLKLHHYPTGAFAWGYQGTGPAQLALALLTHHFTDTGARLAVAKAQALHQDFKEQLVATLPPAGWQLTRYDIADALELIIAKRAQRSFEQALHLAVENAALLHELEDAYTLLERAERNGQSED